MRVIGEEKYRNQPGLKVYRIAFSDDEKEQLKKEFYENYLKFRDNVHNILPKVFNKSEAVIDVFDSVNNIIIVSLWEDNE